MRQIEHGGTARQRPNSSCPCLGFLDVHAWGEIILKIWIFQHWISLSVPNTLKTGNNKTPDERVCLPFLNILVPPINDQWRTISSLRTIISSLRTRISRQTQGTWLSIVAWGTQSRNSCNNATMIIPNPKSAKPENDKWQLTCRYQ